MRRFVFVILILLLPLRGWVGDAMATQMAVPTAVQHAAVAGVTGQMDHRAEPAQAHAPASAAQMADGDCAGHGGVNDASGLKDTAHCGVCTLCQSCHTVAVLQAHENPDAGQSRPAVPQLVAPGFASADRALVLKPPTA